MKEFKSYSTFILLSLTHVMVEKVLFSGQIFEMEILMVMKRYEDP